MKQGTMKILFFVLKTKLLKNGEAPILMRITINGQFEGTNGLSLQNSRNQTERITVNTKKHESKEAFLSNCGTQPKDVVKEKTGLPMNSTVIYLN